jgi:hypothetical protein
LNQKEFDNASFGSMDAASGEHVVLLTLRRWIDTMLRCPQEGVLSPLFWNVDVDYLLCRLHNAHYQTQGYADDVVLLQKSKFVNAVWDRMQIEIVENWCREVGLSVNADKTKMVLFTNNRKI